MSDSEGEENLPPLQRETDDDEDKKPEVAAAATAAAAVPAEGAAENEGDDDDNDEGSDEDDKPYGKKAVKKMVKGMSKPIDTSFADALVADEEGYKTITWAQLGECFSYERPAHGFKLHGDISQKDRENWARSKQIKVRDREGKEGAIFFYDEESQPYFDWEDVQIGNEIVIKSPRYHRFLDGQEGMRVESNKNISYVAKRKFTDAQRLDYGKLNKNNGNEKFKKKKYDDAIGLYETAINHLQGTFHQLPEHEQEARELVAQCFLNVAACQIAQGRFRVVEVACRSALRINASRELNAKAYFRIGHAYLKLHELQPAREALTKAIELAPTDPVVINEVNSLNEAIADDAKAQRELFDLHKRAKETKFGLKKQLLSEPPRTLEGVLNFRDVGGIPTEMGDYQPTPEAPLLRVPKYVLYRSAHLNDITASGLRALADEMRVKTIVDLRTSSEVNAQRAKSQRAVKAFNRQHEIEIALYKKTDGDRGVAALEYHDVESRYAPVNVKCKPDTLRVMNPAKKHPLTKGKSKQEVLQGPVVFHIDMSTRAVLALASWWTLAQAIFFGLLSLIFHRFLKTAARIMIRGTALRLGMDGYYQHTLNCHAPEIAFVAEVASAEEAYPILVHCSMGKDRTGIVVALLLALAGARDADIAADYASTEANLIPDWKELGLDDEWRSAKAETMMKLLAYIRTTFGSVEGYFESIGVDRETSKRIRSILSRPAKK